MTKKFNKNTMCFEDDDVQSSHNTYKPSGNNSSGSSSGKGRIFLFILACILGGVGAGMIEDADTYETGVLFIILAILVGVGWFYSIIKS